MKPFLFLYISILTLVSCAKREIKEVCDCKDPISELEWLNKLTKDSLGGITIYKAIFKYKQSKKLIKRLDGFIVGGFYFGTFYDCSGQSLCSYGGFVGSICEDYDVLEQKKIYGN